MENSTWYLCNPSNSCRSFGPYGLKILLKPGLHCIKIWHLFWYGFLVAQKRDKTGRILNRCRGRICPSPVEQDKNTGAVLNMNHDLHDRIKRLKERLSPCDICPRECGADRLGGETGQCGRGKRWRYPVMDHTSRRASLVGREARAPSFCLLQPEVCFLPELHHQPGQGCF